VNSPDLRIRELLGEAVDTRQIDVDGRLRSVLDQPPRRPNHRLAIAVVALVVAAAGVALAVWAFRGHAPTRPARPAPPGLIAVSRGHAGQPDSTDIYLMRANGKIVRRLTHFSENGNSSRFSDLRGSARAPAWSPDGRKVLFVLDRDGRDDLYVIDVDGKHLRQLTHLLGVNSAAWSPDGRLIAISVRGSGVDVMRPGGAGLHEILPLPRCPGVGPVSWTPDGRVLVTYQCMAGRAEIPPPPLSIVSANGGYSRLFLERFSRAAWSPDGSQVALEGHDGQIWTMHADRTGLHQLTPCSDSEKCPSYDDPTWSPDGREIAFARLGDVSQIYAVNADGSHLHAVTSGPLSTGGPAWQPVGGFSLTLALEDTA